MSDGSIMQVASNVLCIRFHFQAIDLDYDIDEVKELLQLRYICENKNFKSTYYSV